MGGGRERARNDWRDLSHTTPTPQHKALLDPYDTIKLMLAHKHTHGRTHAHCKMKQTKARTIWGA